MATITINYNRNTNGSYNLKFEVTGHITNATKAFQRTEEEQDRFDKVVESLKAIKADYFPNTRTWVTKGHVITEVTETVTEIDTSGLFDSEVTKEIKTRKKVFWVDALEKELNARGLDMVIHHYAK